MNLSYVLALNDEKLEDARAFEARIQEEKEKLAEANQLVADLRKKSAKIEVTTFYNDSEKDKVGFEVWYRSQNNRLTNNEDWFTTDAAKMADIESHLGGEVANNLQPYLETTHPNCIRTSKALMEHLKQQYEDPNKKQKSRAAFAALEMGSLNDFQAFKNEFHKLAGERMLPKDDWKDEFYQRLAPRIKYQVTKNYLDAKVTYQEFVLEVEQLVHTMNQVDADKKKKQGSSSNSSGAGNKNQRQRRFDNRQDSRAPSSSSSSSAPANHKSKLGKPNKAEFDQLLKEGRCFVCREKGHITKDCPRRSQADKDRDARLAVLFAKYGDKGEEEHEDHDVGKEDFLTPFLGGRSFLVSCTIVHNGQTLTTRKCLGDTGADGYIFVNTEFAEKIMKRLKPTIVEDFEERTVSGYDANSRQGIRKVLLVDLVLQGRVFKDVPLMVLNMKHELLIGKLFYETHDILPDTKRRCHIFPPNLPPEDWKRSYHITPPLPPVDWPDTPAKEEELMQRHPSSDKSKRQPDVTQPPRPDRRNDPQREEVNKMNRQLALAQTEPPPEEKPLPPPPQKTKWEHDAQGPYQLRRDAVGWYKHRPFGDIATIGVSPFMRLARRQKSPMHVCTLAEIDSAIRHHPEADALFPDNEKEELKKKAWETVPEEYRDLLRAFSKVDSDTLPPRRSIDHRIEFTEGKSRDDLPNNPLYRMSLEELEVMREYITEQLRKGFIEPGSAPFAAPVLFVPKPGGGLRFCVDYRKLNALSKKDKYPIPLIDETLARISKAKIFTKIDVQQAFNRIRMHPDDEDLTTFKTRYGSFKYKVVPFGLANGPATFQRYINGVLGECLDDFCSAYIDDVLVFSETLEEHRIHVRRVLERLRDAGLQADLKKCEFHVEETKYLGFIVGRNGIRADPEKVAVIRDWKEPKTLKAVQSFVGFCNFYRRFIPRYSRVAKPLFRLTRKDVPFLWDQRCQEAFDELKSLMMSAPVLAYYDYEKETRVETDASDGVIAGCLSQRGDDGEWHPVAFFSETMHDAELNYGIHDKEMLAVIKALQCWRPELIGTQREQPFVIITDHKALEYFSTKQKLNLRQAGWADLLAQYNFLITYRPGSENVVADAMTRKQEELRSQKEKMDFYRHMTMFKLVNETGRIYSLEETPNISALSSGVLLVDEILQQNRTSPDLEIYRAKAKVDTTGDWSLNGGLVTYKGRLVVPKTNHLPTRILREIHGRITSAHPGRGKTRRLVAAQYWWPGLGADCDRYVSNCMECRPAKVPRDKTPGLLQPTPIPLRPFRHLVMDFKEMATDGGKGKFVFVVVDRLSKLPWSTPCDKTVTAQEAARLYYEGPFRIFGLPQKIDSDRGPQFISSFTDELAKILGIEWKLSSSGHHESAGQAEIVIEYLDQRLRLFCNYYQTNWAEALPAMDFAVALLLYESTGLQLYEVLFGFSMLGHLDWLSCTIDVMNLLAKEKLNREDVQKIA
ncbi:hypothetical protein O1611_g5714 [Lasiodiplodia mahajangana]|uniref:Uncharacterized protein n=1 Tax=Lasiodiplodia mahajangana TaxID=1108764 RepID=A0ACC2JKN8_9PEZI|nr:hypothetical protein O1611_g5714 [Lasiodiplodia mahajangana]